MPRLSAVLVLFAVTMLVLGVHDLTRGLTGASLIVPATAPDAPDPEATPDVAPEPGDEAGDEKADLITEDIEAGTVVTTANGVTLYRSDRDSSRPSKSNCSGPCAAQWPPMWATSGLPTVDGIDPKLLGTVTRGDGNKQLTLAGWPLYQYAADSPGEAAGNGVGGTWHAVGPDGNSAVQQADEPAPAPVVRPPAIRPAPRVVRTPAPKQANKQKKHAQEQKRKEKK